MFKVIVLLAVFASTWHGWSGSALAQAAGASAAPALSDEQKEIDRIKHALAPQRLGGGPNLGIDPIGSALPAHVPPVVAVSGSPPVATLPGAPSTPPVVEPAPRPAPSPTLGSQPNDRCAWSDSPEGGLRFLIPFEFNSDVVDPKALPCLGVIAKALHPDCLYRIEGHTDTSGTPAYNMDLSSRRAGNVVGVLTGMNPDLANFLKSSGKGKLPPLRVQTADGVREPGNRYVSIFLATATEQPKPEKCQAP